MVTLEKQVIGVLDGKLRRKRGLRDRNLIGLQSAFNLIIATTKGEHNVTVERRRAITLELLKKPARTPR